MSSAQFSEPVHAEIYNIYRPDIPEKIAQKFVSYLLKEYQGPRYQAVDVGCGSGQSTVILAPFFKHVMGIDESSAQINEAQNSRILPNINFKMGPAEILPFDNGSVQLVTSCASLHWFHKESFFAEVRRILAPNGVFAAYTYHFIKPLTDDPVCNGKIDCLFTEKYKELFPYFAEEVFSSLEKYKDVTFPFEEVLRTSDVRQTFNGKLSDVLGYIETLSGFQNWKKKDPLESDSYIMNFAERLKTILQMDIETEDKILELYRDFYIILCRKCQSFV